LIVFWEGNSGTEKAIYAQKVSQMGTWMGDRLRLDTPGISALPKLPKVSVGDQNIAVVWESNQDGNDEIYLSIIQDDWTASVPTNLSQDRYRSHTPSITWDGSQYAVLWADHRVEELSQLMMMRISATGEPQAELSHLSLPDLAANRSSIVASGINEFWISSEMSTRPAMGNPLVQIYTGQVTCTPPSQEMNPERPQE
jgi:hypothetical protein